MLVISVVSVSILAAASTMVPLFRTGVEDLGADVQKILETGSVDGGRGSSNSGNSGASSSDVSNTVNEMGSEVDTAGNGDIGSFLG